MGNQMSEQDMQNHIFNLRMASKQMERLSKKCDKNECTEKVKTKKAIQKCNLNVAKIHAENAIRQKHQSCNYLQMANRIDAVAGRVEMAKASRQVLRNMGGVVKVMDAAMKSMNLEQISGVMDKFEKAFEDIDVQTDVMENTMSQTTTTLVPQNEVENLMQQVADEAGLELNMELPQNPVGATVAPSEASQEQDDLTRRLARLREV